MILLETEDNKGNKAKIEVTEFRTYADAVKEIQNLRREIQELKDKLKEKKRGTNS